MSFSRQRELTEYIRTTRRRTPTRARSSRGLSSAIGYDIYNYPEPFMCEAQKWHFNNPYFDASNLRQVVNFEKGQKIYFNPPSVG